MVGCSNDELFRRRAMIPLAYLLILVDYLSHNGIGLMKPTVRAGAPTSSFAHHCSLYLPFG